MSSLPAQACSPIPPPEQEAGEADSVYRERIARWNYQQQGLWQRQAWTNAASIALVRIVAFEPHPMRYYPELKQARVKLVRWVKGQGGAIDFAFRPIIGQCSGESTLAHGKRGKTYLVYFSSSKARRSKIEGATPADLIQDRSGIDGS